MATLKNAVVNNNYDIKSQYCEMLSNNYEIRNWNCDIKSNINETKSQNYDKNQLWEKAEIMTVKLSNQISLFWQKWLVPLS